VTAATGSQRAGMATVLAFLALGAVILAGVRDPGPARPGPAGAPPAPP
jgi:MFS-type transporter involved in bile tolerance (Atg22 family)